MGKYNRVLVISDLQAPFHHPASLLFLKAVKKDFRCDLVTCVGDEIDAHALSVNFPVDPDADYTPKTETLAAIDFLKSLYSTFPKVKVCNSNHTQRPWRKAFNAGISGLFLKSVREALQAPSGWIWRDSWVIDRVKYTHGDEHPGGPTTHFRAAFQNRMSTVIGHVHAHGGIQYLDNGSDKPGGRIFGLNTGCLIDRKSYAFRYGAKKATKVTLGCGVVLGPEEAYFIPFG